MAEVGTSRDYRLAQDFIERHGGAWVSKRDGLVVVRVRAGAETWLLWFRSTPITERALRLFDRVRRRYRHDRALVVRAGEVADYVAFRDIEDLGIELATLEEVEERLGG